MGMERRTFYGPDIDLANLAHSLADSFSREGQKTQVMPGPNAGFVVQAGKEDTLRKIAGMATALTAIFTLENEYVCAEVGGAKWLEKGVTAGVGVGGSSAYEASPNYTDLATDPGWANASAWRCSV